MPQVHRHRRSLVEEVEGQVRLQVESSNQRLAVPSVLPRIKLDLYTLYHSASEQSTTPAINATCDCMKHDA